MHFVQFFIHAVVFKHVLPDIHAGLIKQCAPCIPLSRWIDEMKYQNRVGPHMMGKQSILNFNILIIRDLQAFTVDFHEPQKPTDRRAIESSHLSFKQQGEKHNVGQIGGTCFLHNYSPLFARHHYWVNWTFNLVYIRLLRRPIRPIFIYCIANHLCT